MSQTLETATSIIRVDLPAVKRNVERIRRHIGPDTEIMYVAKSNGYGNGIVEPAVFLKREPLAHLLSVLQALPNLEVDGVFTHLANAYSLDKSVTHAQQALFEKALAQLRAVGICPRMTHMANTAACVASPECYYNAVRLAALIFGHDISPGEQNRLHLELATSWRCYVLNTMWVNAGESVSYYRYYVPDRRTRIALVSFGMGDGYIRAAVSQDIRKNAEVLINGHRARLIDLNFDQTFVDITDVPGEVNIGDVVTIIGRDGGEEITTTEIADRAHTSNGNVCASITSRPFRQYIYE